jgi:TusA-related sulfurtransferase
MPIVALAKAVRSMETGQVLEVQAKDRAFRSDIEAWARRTGHSIDDFKDGEIQVAFIRVQ